MPMRILTLTTDFGTKDYYLSAFKGLILSQLNKIHMVDISHEIEAFNIQSAAYNLRNSWQNFPPKSLHVCRVGESVTKQNRYLAFEFEKHYFLLPDNGIITLILDKYPKKVFVLLKEIEEQSNSDFLSKAIAHILKNDNLDGLGNETTNYQERIDQKPILSSVYIRGVVQHIDRYGNLITNIDRELFESHHGNREFEVLTRAVSFRRIAKNYASVPPGEKLCCFNSSGFLQLSINQGNAHELFGLHVADIIQVDFL